MRIGERVTAIALARLDDAIRQLVAGAIEDHRAVRSMPEAERLAAIYSASGLSTTQIAELLVRAASAAGVMTELTGIDFAGVRRDGGVVMTAQ